MPHSGQQEGFVSAGGNTHRRMQSGSGAQERSSCIDSDSKQSLLLCMRNMILRHGRYRSLL